MRVYAYITGSAIGWFKASELSYGCTVDDLMWKISLTLAAPFNLFRDVINDNGSVVLDCHAGRQVITVVCDGVQVNKTFGKTHLITLTGLSQQQFATSQFSGVKPFSISADDTVANVLEAARQHYGYTGSDAVINYEGTSWDVKAETLVYNGDLAGLVKELAEVSGCAVRPSTQSRIMTLSPRYPASSGAVADNASFNPNDIASLAIEFQHIPKTTHVTVTGTVVPHVTVCQGGNGGLHKSITNKYHHYATTGMLLGFVELTGSNIKTKLKLTTKRQTGLAGTDPTLAPETLYPSDLVRIDDGLRVYTGVATSVQYTFTENSYTMSVGSEVHVSEPSTFYDSNLNTFTLEPPWVYYGTTAPDGSFVPSPEGQATVTSYDVNVPITYTSTVTDPPMWIVSSDGLTASIVGSNVEVHNTAEQADGTLVLAVSLPGEATRYYYVDLVFDVAQSGYTTTDTTDCCSIASVNDRGVPDTVRYFNFVPHEYDTTFGGLGVAEDGSTLFWFDYDISTGNNMLITFDTLSEQSTSAVSTLTKTEFNTVNSNGAFSSDGYLLAQDIGSYSVKYKNFSASVVQTLVALSADYEYTSLYGELSIDGSTAVVVYPTVAAFFGGDNSHVKVKVFRKSGNSMVANVTVDLSTLCPEMVTTNAEVVEENGLNIRLNSDGTRLLVMLNASKVVREYLIDYSGGAGAFSLVADRSGINLSASTAKFYSATDIIHSRGSMYTPACQSFCDVIFKVPLSGISSTMQSTPYVYVNAVADKYVLFPDEIGTVVRACNVRGVTKIANKLWILVTTDYNSTTAVISVDA